jgi:WD40 repeat protein
MKGVVAFSPDGHLVASAGYDGYVRCGTPPPASRSAHPLPADPGFNIGVGGVAFSPDGHLLAGAGYDGYVRLWNPATGQPVSLFLATNSASSADLVDAIQVAFSPDGHLLASVEAGQAMQTWQVWPFT